MYRALTNIAGCHCGIDMISDEVLGITYDGEYTVETKRETHRAPCVILATGASRKTPRIEGLSGFEGKGVSYCAVCDAFFYRGKSVAVLGDGDYALHEASELLPVVGSVTLLTNGREPSAQFPEQIRVNKKEIAALRGDIVLESIAFRDGSTQPISGLFVALGVASSTDFARTMQEYLVDFATAEEIKLKMSGEQNIVFKDILGFEHTVTPEEIQNKTEPVMPSARETDTGDTREF